MAVGRPFQTGDDPRRGTAKPPPNRKRSLMELARAERAGTVKALVRLRDQEGEPRIALEAAKLLMRYADGEPGAHNVPPPPPDGDDAGGDLGLEPPPLSPDVEAAIDGPRGGDAGGPADGNGGAA